ncbi:MAG: TlpA disulfide reductase family protein [Burkholderiaceae bacterium]
MKRRDWFRQLALAPLAVPAAGLQAHGRPADPAAPAPGTVITLPAARLIDGTVLPAEHWRDKVVVIELWATWCPFCAQQNPYLDRLHREHSARRLEVIGLSIDRDVEAVKAYVAKNDYRFHVAMFDADWKAAIGHPRGLPIVWVVGRDGRLARLEIGELFAEDVASFAELL